MANLAASPDFAGAAAGFGSSLTGSGFGSSFFGSSFTGSGLGSSLTGSGFEAGCPIGPWLLNMANLAASPVFAGADFGSSFFGSGLGSSFFGSGLGSSFFGGGIDDVVDDRCGLFPESLP